MDVVLPAITPHPGLAMWGEVVQDQVNPLLGRTPSAKKLQNLQHFLMAILPAGIPPEQVRVHIAEMQANDGPGAAWYRSQEADQPCGCSCDLPVNVSPRGQIRRRQRSGRLVRKSLHTCESVSFSLEPWIGALVPCLGATESDLLLSQNLLECLQTDRISDFFFNKVSAKLGQRPAFEGSAQRIQRTQRLFNNEAFVFFGEFLRSPASVFGLEGIESALVEFLDDGANTSGQEAKMFCDGRNFTCISTQ